MGSYNFFKDIIGGKIEKEPYNSTIENIIFKKTIFSAKDKFITEKIESEYLKSFTKEQLKKINSKNFSAWGRLSRKFLFEISFEDKETGEIFENIIEALEKTNNNLMELLSSKYTLKEKLEEENRTDEDFKNKINDRDRKSVV